MLIGYYLGKVPRDQVFGPLSDDETFKGSPFANIRLSRLGMLCEAHFYDALLNHAAGSPAKMRAALEAVLSTGYRPYVEFSMAKFLLGDKGPGSPQRQPEQPEQPEQHTTR